MFSKKYSKKVNTRSPQGVTETFQPGIIADEYDHYDWYRAKVDALFFICCIFCDKVRAAHSFYTTRWVLKYIWGQTKTFFFLLFFFLLKNKTKKPFKDHLCLVRAIKSTAAPSNHTPENLKDKVWKDKEKTKFVVKNIIFYRSEFHTAWH